MPEQARLDLTELALPTDRPSPLPGKFPWEGLFLHLDHWQHTVSAQDVDLFCGPDGLAALGANQLAGAAEALVPGSGPPSRLGRAPCPRAEEGRQTGPPYGNLAPPL